MLAPLRARRAPESLDAVCGVQMASNLVGADGKPPSSCSIEIPMLGDEERGLVRSTLSMADPFTLTDGHRRGLAAAGITILRTPSYPGLVA